MQIAVILTKVGSVSLYLNQSSLYNTEKRKGRKEVKNSSYEEHFLNINTELTYGDSHKVPPGHIWAFGTGGWG